MIGDNHLLKISIQYEGVDEVSGAQEALKVWSVEK